MSTYVNFGSGFNATPVAGDCMQFIAPLTYNRGRTRVNTSDFDWFQFF